MDCSGKEDEAPEPETPLDRYLRLTPEEREQSRQEFLAIQRAKKRGWRIFYSIFIPYWLWMMWGAYDAISATGRKYHLWPFGLF